MRMHAAWLMFALVVGAAVPAGAQTPAAAETGWRAAITAFDRDRLDRLEEAIRQGDREAAATRPDPRLAAELEALMRLPARPASAKDLLGAWRCRTIKVGPYGIVAYPFFRCRIGRQGHDLVLEKTSGSQRVSGRLFPEDVSRFVFLGGATVNGEPQRPYSGFAGRPADDGDVVGVLTRTGGNRLRVVFPLPHFESTYDVYELVR